MIELEQVDKLREKANVSFAEAKEALEASGGDMLDALIYLENQGKAMVPPGGGFFSSGNAPGGNDSGKDWDNNSGAHCNGKENPKRKGESFWDMLKRFGRFCLKLIDKGNNNYLDASKNDAPLFSLPVTVIVVFLLFFFWVTIPLFVLSLFFGFRYHFRGAELGRDCVNKVMDDAADAVHDMKNSFTDGAEKL